MYTTTEDIKKPLLHKEWSNHIKMKNNVAYTHDNRHLDIEANLDTLGNMLKLATSQGINTTCIEFRRKDLIRIQELYQKVYIEELEYKIKHIDFLNTLDEVK